MILFTIIIPFTKSEVITYTIQMLDSLALMESHGNKRAITQLDRALA